MIAIRRRYWQCRCGRPGSYAVDEVLGLEGRFSRVLQKHCCRLAADTSFAATREHLREMLGVRLSAESVRTLVESHARAMAKFQLEDVETAQAFVRASGEVELAVDAAKVNTREEGWKDLKIAVISKRERGRPCQPEEFEGQRLAEPTMVLSFAMIAKAKAFRRSWRLWLRRLGVREFAGVHVLGDGAAWIWKSVPRSLAGCTQTLDFYHACEHVARCAERIFGEGTAAKAEAFEWERSYRRGRGLLLAHGWSGVCRWVSELLAVEDEAERERRRLATEKLIGYFQGHVGRLNYAARLAEGRAIGSGVVEGQAKTLGLRLKRRGARWRRRNVPAMASLVCVRHSPQWHAYWSLAT